MSTYQEFKQALELSIVDSGTIYIEDDYIYESFYGRVIDSLVIPFDVPFSKFSVIKSDYAEHYCHEEQIAIPFSYFSYDGEATKFYADLKKYYESIN